MIQSLRDKMRIPFDSDLFVARAESIPHIPFIPMQSVSFQESSILLLECHLPMMFFLILDVGFHRADIGLAHGKRAVTVLPIEVSRGLLFDANGRTGFEFLHQFGNRDCPAEVAQNVNVVFHNTDNERWTVDVLQGADQVSRHRAFEFGCLQERSPVFG